MKEIFVEKDTLPQAYHEAILQLYKHGVETDCSWGGKQKQVSMTMVINHPLEEPRISKLFIGDPLSLEQYRQEILYGILDFEIDKGNWEYTYHDRIFNYEGIPSLSVAVAYEDKKIAKVDWEDFAWSINQIEFVIEELKNDNSSRRAVVMVRNTKDIGSSDPACLQHIHFLINEEGKLDCKVLFRSNDAIKASFMNMFALICLQEEVAKRLEIEVGSYTHRANSYHCYERDYDTMETYVACIKNSGDDVTFDYKDDWDELMEEAKEEIAKKVEELRNR